MIPVFHTGYTIVGEKIMNNKTIDLSFLSFVRAKKENIGIVLEIIRRCILEINAADYIQTQVEHLFGMFGLILFMFNGGATLKI